MTSFASLFGICSDSVKINSLRPVTPGKALPAEVFVKQLYYVGYTKHFYEMWEEEAAECTDWCCHVHLHITVPSKTNMYYNVC